MGPKRGTKAYNEEYLWVVYGINPRLGKVQTVWVQRNRVLIGRNDKGEDVRHAIKPGWTHEREAQLIFGLREIFSVPAGLDSEYKKKRIEELEAKIPDVVAEYAKPIEDKSEES